MKIFLQKRYLIVLFIIFIVLSLSDRFCFIADAQTNEQELKVKELSETKTEEQKKIEEAKEGANEAKTEAEAAKKEAAIQEKTVELEKKKAEVKLKEAEVAKKEVAVVIETAKTKEEVQDALEHARDKEKEALAAKELVELAEEKMLAAQEKAHLAGEELKIAQERAKIAENKIKQRQLILYNKALQTIFVIIIGYLLIFLFVGIINRRVKDIKIRHIARKNVVYFLNFAIMIFIAYVWIHNINSITIFLSFMGAGLALALQEVILSIAGWVLILVRKPFEVGDRIELGGVKGDVIDIRLFQTSLLEIGNWVADDQSTGRIVNVPNSAIFKKENYNYSRGFEFIWNEIRVLVTFESDWKRGEEIMMQHAKQVAEGMDEVVKRDIHRMTRHYMIYYDKLTPIVYVNIKDSGVELTLRYLTEARKRRDTHDRLCRAILNDFEKEERVNFAYPTYRIVK